MIRRWNDDVYVRWARELAEGRDPIAGAESLTPENRIAEEVYLGLRSTAGLRLREEERDRVTAWVEAGWGELHNEGAQGSRGGSGAGLSFRASPLGWLRLDALAADLTAFRSR